MPVSKDELELLLLREIVEKRSTCRATAEKVLEFLKERGFEKPMFEPEVAARDTLAMFTGGADSTAAR